VTHASPSHPGTLKRALGDAELAAFHARDDV
jgi:hypothetical protein